jgi:hypothetical protein
VKDHPRRRRKKKGNDLEEGFEVTADEASIETRAREARWGTRR